MRRECKRCGKTWVCNGNCRGDCLCISCFKFHYKTSPKERAELHDVCFPNSREKAKVKVIFT